MSVGKRSFKRWASVTGVLVLLVLSAAAICTAGCGDSTPATSAPATSAPATSAPATSAPATPTSAAVADQTTTTLPAESPATETSAGGGAAVRTVGESDSGNEIILRVGDRVRIELEPYVNDRVKAVTWNYEPIVVREVDTGTEVVSDVVIGCWLELEATIVGSATVRAEYEYPYGTRQTTWVAYFRVRE